MLVVFVAVPSDTAEAQVPAQCDVFDPEGVSVTTQPLTNVSTWNIQGSGVCNLGSVNENFNVTIQGTGTSTSLGLCSNELLLTNLKLLVTATYSNNNQTITQTQIWNVPLAVQPTTVPFTIVGPSNGAGVASTRLLLKCPGSGTDAARFIWAQTL